MYVLVDFMNIFIHTFQTVYSRGAWVPKCGMYADFSTRGWVLFGQVRGAGTF